MSTKSGLDPGGVWQAWGMASLKAGNLSGAREKFARCLKPPVDRNQLNSGPLLLQEIVQHLETMVRPSLAMVGSYFHGGTSLQPPAHNILKTEEMGRCVTCFPSANRVGHRTTLPSQSLIYNHINIFNISALLCMHLKGQTVHECKC